MILWLVKFPKRYRPRRMAFKTYEQAMKVKEHFGLLDRHVEVLYLEEDDNRMPFTKD